MGYVIQILLNFIACFIAVMLVIGVLIWNDVITVIMDESSLKEAKERGSNLNGKNVYVVKHKEGALCYKLASEVIDNLEDECSESKDEEPVEEACEDNEPEEEVVTEEVVKEDATEEVRTE